MSNQADRDSVASHCSTSFDFKCTLDKMRQLRVEMAKHPNRLVMTTRTLVRLREATESQEKQFEALAMPNAFMGTPIEDYATVKECMDRMMNQQEGERLQLVMSEGVPVECIDHPWMKKSINEMAHAFRFRHLERDDRLGTWNDSNQPVASVDLQFENSSQRDSVALHCYPPNGVDDGN